MRTIRDTELRIRDMVRHEGVDPQWEHERLERIINAAIAEHEELAVLGQAEHLEEIALVRRKLRDAVGGYGPLQPFLDDPNVEEIWIDNPGAIFVSKGGRTELTPVVLTEQQVRDLVERMLRASGRRLDLSSPFVDASLETGERLHVVIPDITRKHWAVNIRRYVLRARTLSELVRAGTLPPLGAAFLDAAMRAGLNVLVSGATQAGKTTLLRALMGSVPAAERIITAEEVFELGLEHRDVVAMQTRPPSIEDRGEVTLRRLVREALRMRPERIVIGEVRAAEAFDLLVALNSGVPGACTIHANSAREAILKLSTLPLLAGENVTSAFVVPTVAGAVDIVVHIERDRRGRRSVTEICAVTGRVEGMRVETTTLFGERDGSLVRLPGEVPRLERFERAGIDIASVLGGA
ncbi:MAG: ATPase, T2SS/T4P/T4SS family [Actinomycetaceae bacterium]|nr:ATPase, T2SS/T4P/T4SS family [Actinomycetaceae bacterium]